MNEHDESVEVRRALRRATEVLVIGGHAPFNSHARESNEVLARGIDADVIADTVSSLAFTVDVRMDWMSLGTPGLVFLDGRELIGDIRLLLPNYVRCEGFWDGDALLAAPQLLADVLVKLGVTP